MSTEARNQKRSGSGWTGPLEGKSAVVTGGAAGIGLGISRRLARDGATVAIFDLDDEAAQHTASDLTAEGYTAIGCCVNVSDRAQVEQAAASTRERLGPITVLVNNAGIDVAVPFMAMDEETWNRVFAVNMTGVFHCTQVFVPDMIEAQWGRIINISSSSAQRGAPNRTAYSASKGAVISFTRSLALELAPYAITVNNIPPNFIWTPMLQRAIELGHIPAGSLEVQIKQTPVGRAGQPEDIAAACAFLASPDASYITAQTLGVNGGRFP